MSVRLSVIRIFVISFLIAPALWAQQDPVGLSKGPIITDYGPVFPVPHLDFATPREDIYRVIFDVSRSPDDKSAVNPRLETLARFLNMHAQQEIPAKRMKIAVVLHGGAGKDALASRAYEQRYGVANPNQPLLEALDRVGVEIFLCGQTAGSRNLPKANLMDSVKMALSAMTVLVKYQSDGYSLIAF